MKKAIFLITSFAMLLMAGQTFAQADTQEEKKNKVVMSITDGGKVVNTEVTSVSISVSRYEDSDEEEQVPEIKPAAGKDTSKVKLPKSQYRRGNGLYYFSVDARSLSPELLRVLAKPKAKFNGSVTITDPDTRKVLKTLKFTQAALNSYSDQFSGITNSSYGYGSSVLAIVCKGLSIDGVNFD